jgi:heme-degrading monooxygenase HmoA
LTSTILEVIDWASDGRRTPASSEEEIRIVTTIPAPVETAQHRYRVDKFVVPAQAREEFLKAAAEAHALLQAQEGFVRGYILDQQSGPGTFNVVTFVEWESQAVVERVSAFVTQLYREKGYDPAERLRRLGITQDVGIYVALDATSR